MSLETVLVAVGDNDEDRIEKLAQTAIDIAGPAGATVKLAHVFTDDSYQELRTKLDFGPDAEVTPDVVAKRHVTIRELGDALDEAGVSDDQVATGESADERQHEPCVVEVDTSQEDDQRREMKRDFECVKQHEHARHGEIQHGGIDCEFGDRHQSV
jgi:hypothetical protein